jgi:hypothetical protein
MHGNIFQKKYSFAIYFVILSKILPLSDWTLFTVNPRYAFSGMSFWCNICHLWQMMHMPYNLLSVPYRIHKNCYNKLNLVWSVNVISCITIRVAVSVALFIIRMWQSQNLCFVIRHALNMVSIHYWWLHMLYRCIMQGLEYNNSLIHLQY